MPRLQARKSAMRFSVSTPSRRSNKLLKARLTSIGVDYPKVHNLLTMVELLAAEDDALPDDLADLFRLTPFATTFRYEEPDEPILPDRLELRRRIAELRDLVQRRIADTPAKP